MNKNAVFYRSIGDTKFRVTGDLMIEYCFPPNVYTQFKLNHIQNFEVDDSKLIIQFVKGDNQYFFDINCSLQNLENVIEISQCRIFIRFVAESQSALLIWGEKYYLSKQTDYEIGAHRID
ncbi:hypothetical protein RF11_10890 [Thelohanellus kitauei]|uniref:Uncharacterized protein n=1 Tax=Thelohanellus kitauei TaxID=669202 RepID=A0A0C2MS19_THEKT|nr:hypothetical protein RF11_10890 [Thelohanellus kitauei]